MMFPGSSKINQPSTRFDEEEKQKDEYLRPLYELRRRANESDGPITNFHQLIRSSENNQPSLSITRSDEENERNDVCNYFISLILSVYKFDLIVIDVFFLFSLGFRHRRHPWFRINAF